MNLDDLADCNLGMSEFSTIESWRGTWCPPVQSLCTYFNFVGGRRFPHRSALSCDQFGGVEFFEETNPNKTLKPP